MHHESQWTRRLLDVLLLVSMTASWPIMVHSHRPRIIGGSEVASGEYNYTVGLRRSMYDAPFCGGTLVSSTHVITAAHCIQSTSGTESDRSAIIVSVGTTQLPSTRNQLILENHIVVVNASVHPDFDPDTRENDIAILELGQPVARSLDLVYGQISRINYSTEPTLTSNRGFVTGWGTTSLGLGLTSLRLRATELRIMQNNRECQDRWTNRTRFHIRPSMICAGGTTVGTGVCVGDSGGPLVVFQETGKPTLVGVVSWGQPCAVGLPDVFTRVSVYQAWIDRVLHPATGQISEADSEVI